MQDLIDLDTSASRKALEALAGSKDDRLAAQALVAIGRADYSGAKTFLKGVLGDTKRTGNARVAALSSYCVAEQRGGSAWNDVKDHCKGASTSDTVLDSARDALKAKLWGEE